MADDRDYVEVERGDGHVQQGAFEIDGAGDGGKKADGNGPEEGPPLEEVALGGPTKYDPKAMVRSLYAAFPPAVRLHAGMHAHMQAVARRLPRHV
jgi:hypothetical protein